MEKVRVKHHYPLSSKTQKDQIEAFLWTEKRPPHPLYTQLPKICMYLYLGFECKKKISDLNFIWEKMLVIVHLTDKG